MKQFGSFRLDTAKECLWRDGVQIPLPPRQFLVLRYLVENPGRLITHEELLDALWPETYVQPQVLRTYMLDLRKVLGDDAGQPHFIQTLPKRGYCFVAPVREVEGSGPRAAPAITQKEEAIFGREAPLAHLEEQLQQVLSGQRRVVFVTGEPGIGKTALLDTFCRQAVSTRQVNIARGQCVEGLGAKEEYYPVIEALGQLCASPEGELACRTLARVAPAWLGALGREDTPAHAAHSSGAERMPGDLCAALEELAAQTPLILVFEDLHWGDAATLNLISALARRRAPARLMVLVSCGLGDSAPEHPFRGVKQDLLLRQLCTQLTLTPLTQAAVKEMLSSRLRQEKPPPGLASFVQQRSEGNPLFALTILEHLMARNFLVRDENNEASLWKASGPFREMEAEVPEGLAQMMELEMERLTPEEQRILEAASLMGFAFPAWAVAAALEEDPATTEERCSSLARRLRFLARAGHDELPGGIRSEFYVFVHGLYREVLYQRQTAAQRASRHQRIARRLGELFAGRESSVAREMAQHYEAAGEWERAVSALHAAARYAQERQASAEATELSQQALRLAENLSGPMRAAAVREIHELFTMAGEPLDDGGKLQKA